MAARQANTGPGIRREGGRITTKRPLARGGEGETEQSQPPDWHRRVLGPGTAGEPIASGGRVCSAPCFLAPALSAHCLQLSSFLAGPHSTAREPGAGAEPGYRLEVHPPLWYESSGGECEMESLKES